MRALVDACYARTTALLQAHGDALRGVAELLLERETIHQGDLERIAGADKRLADGADEELQLVDAAATLLRGVQKLVVAADRERMYM